MENGDRNLPHTPREVGDRYFGDTFLRALTLLDGIATDPELEKRFPRTAAVLPELTEALHVALDEVDLCLSAESMRAEYLVDLELERQVQEGLDRALEGLDPPRDMETSDES